MKVIDISLTITPGMPVWPGDNTVDLHRRTKIEEGANANVSFLAASAHTGTHVDAPYHFLPDGNTVENLPLDVLVGPVQVVQITSNIEVITEDVLRQLKLEPVVERVLFKTSNSNLWKNPEAPFNTQFVGIDESGAKYLVDHKIKLVGIDYLSIAPFKKSRLTHELLLGAGMVIVEGLDLSAVSAGKYTLCCLPLKLKGADGAPARAVLIEN
ncbi:MAG: cyclase family protein [Anaerolineaceae bacterium]